MKFFLLFRVYMYVLLYYITSSNADYKLLDLLCSFTSFCSNNYSLTDTCFLDLDLDAKLISLWLLYFSDDYYTLGFNDQVP